MNSKRYGIFGGVSLALHSLILSASPPKEALLVDLNSHSPSINIQFIATSVAPVKAMTTPLPDTAEKAIQHPIPQTLAHDTAPAIPKPVTKPITETKATPAVKKTNSNTTENAKHIEKPTQPNNTAKEKSPSPRPEEKATPTISQAAVETQKSTPKLVEKPTFRAKPTAITYPRIAKKKGLQGKVLVEVWIDQRGQQIKRILLDSSGFSVLDDAAMSAISHWEFNASTEQGINIAHRVQIPVNFKLD